MRYTNKILSGSPQLPLMQYAYNNVCTDKSSFQFCAILRCYGYIGSIKGSSKRYTCQVREWVLCVCVCCVLHMCIVCACSVCALLVSASFSWHPCSCAACTSDCSAAARRRCAPHTRADYSSVIILLPAMCSSSTFCLPCIRAYHVVILYVSVLLPPTCL